MPCECVVPIASQFIDDETLFGAFTLLREKPHVIVCFESHVQASYGIAAATREAETAAAMEILGCSWEQWRYPDNERLPGWSGPQINSFVGATSFHLSLQAADRGGRVYAPAIEDDGHDQHNMVGRAALEIFGPDRVTQYMTYRRGHGRSDGIEVPMLGAFLRLKLRALACYRSQIETHAAGCWPWFLDGQREYYADA